jgi:hypothetical protein
MILLGVVFIKTSSWVDPQRGPGIPLEALISDYLLSLWCHQTWLRNSQQKWRCWQCWWEKSEIHLKIGNFPLPSLITSRVSVGDDIWKIGQKKLFRCSDIYPALIVKVRFSNGFSHGFSGRNFATKTGRIPGGHFWRQSESQLSEFLRRFQDGRMKRSQKWWRMGISWGLMGFNDD